MKQGLESIDQLTATVNANMHRKRDYIADVRNTEMQYIGADKFKLSIEDTANMDNANYVLADHALKQMGVHFKVPGSYINYMRSEGRGDLLADNFNNWFKKPVNKHTRRLYRGLAGEYSQSNDLWRSFHSNRFSRFDHEHALEAIMPAVEEVAEEMGGLKVASAGVTDNKMYIKLLFPKTEAKVVGDVVQIGLTIGNSEIGLSNVYVLPLIYVLRCLNGMVLPQYGHKKKHLGSAMEMDGNITYAEDTIESELETVKLKLRDTVKKILSHKTREEIISSVNDAATSQKTANPMKAVEATAKLFDLTDKETADTTLSFVKLGNYSKWGMVNAVTEIANTNDSYDRASELESIGGKILSMNDDKWYQIATTVAH
tara:strand:- start:347 stop:1462 length:1116 start_codon:yes stop_codon:yes gene_type:complete